MDRPENQKEKTLKIIDEDESPGEEVVRLERQGGKDVPKAVPRPPRHAEVEHAIPLQAENTAERRTHKPEVDEILTGKVQQEALEESWAGRKRIIPYGWFMLIFLVVGVAAFFAVTNFGGDRSDTAATARQRAVEKADELEDEDARARRFVDNVESAIARFLAAEEPEELLAVVRHPQRVAPLIDEWYQTHEMKPSEFKKMEVFQPTNVRAASFWRTSSIVQPFGREEEETRALLVEELEGNVALIDWETAVGYQPVPWDEYVADPVAGEAFDFRVTMVRDELGLYSHEFRDERKWQAYRLWFRDRDVFLVGYAKRESPAWRRIEEILVRNQMQPSTVTLRLYRNPETRSPRGVEIREMVRPRWPVVDGAE